MKLNQILKALYATYLTNYYGFKMKNSSSKEKKEYRILYATELLGALKISVTVKDAHKIPKDGQYLIASNHKSVIDPLVVELALKDSHILGHWISKKELYNSFFFGMFVRNGGSVLLDRENSKMRQFFTDIKSAVNGGDSISIFPEGTRNKSKEAIGEFKDGTKIIAIKNRLPILPLYISSDANKVLMDSLKSGKLTQTIEVEIGDIIEYRDKTQTLQEAYKSQFNLK